MTNIQRPSWLEPYVRISDLAQIRTDSYGNEEVACPDCAQSSPVRRQSRFARYNDFCYICASKRVITVFVEELGGWIQIAGNNAIPLQLWADHLTEIPPETLYALWYSFVLKKVDGGDSIQVSEPVRGPASDREWSSYGFANDEIPRWKQARFDDPESAKEWKDYGFTPEDAALWCDKNFDPDQAADYADADLTPGEAIQDSNRWQRVLGF